MEVLTEYSAPAMVNHCVRSYLFAASRAAIDGIEIDHELLYVAALLHDLGLEPAFDSYQVPFEDAGGQVAWVFAAGAGWPAARRRRVADVVIAHMREFQLADDPEGYLLAVATGLDIAGVDRERWPAELIGEIVTARPRLDLAPRFTALFEQQAARKPQSAAAALMHQDGAALIAANPLERL
jgi:hypothetical protein